MARFQHIDDINSGCQRIWNGLLSSNKYAFRMLFNVKIASSHQCVRCGFLNIGHSIKNKLVARLPLIPMTC